MAEIKYYYNPDTCQYERIRIKKSDVFINTLGLLSTAFVLAVVIMVLFTTYYNTPSEKVLIQENKALKNHFASLNTEYSDINQMVEVLNQRNKRIYGTIYEIDLIEESVTTETSNHDRLLAEGHFSDKTFYEFSTKIDKLKSDFQLGNQILPHLEKDAYNNRDLLQNIPSIQPITNKNHTALVSGFGMRINPYHHGVVKHEGIDFSAPRGTPIFATANGKIAFVKNSTLTTGGGNKVEIDHGHGFLTRYLHMQDINVKAGQTVKRGDIIGFVGSSGGAIAPHVHYEVVKDGVNVNPLNYFIKDINEKDYIKLHTLAVRNNQSLD